MADPEGSSHFFFLFCFCFCFCFNILNTFASVLIKCGGLFEFTNFCLPRLIKFPIRCKVMQGPRPAYVH